MWWALLHAGMLCLVLLIWWGVLDEGKKDTSVTMPLGIICITVVYIAVLYFNNR